MPVIKVTNDTRRSIYRAARTFPAKETTGPIKVTDYGYAQIKGCVRLQVKKVDEKELSTDNTGQDVSLDTGQNENMETKEVQKEEQTGIEGENKEAIEAVGEELSDSGGKKSENEKEETVTDKKVDENTEENTEDELMAKTLKELRSMGQSLGVDHYWTKNKETLVADIKAIEEEGE